MQLVGLERPGWPMVSVPSGAGAKKAVQKQLPLLQGYDEIVIFTTMTNQVAKPLKSVLVYYRLQSRLPTSRATTRTPQTPSKPMTQTLYAIWDAKPFRPDGIVDGKTLLDLVTTPSPAADHDYPFQGLQSKLHDQVWRACHNHRRIWHRQIQLLSQLTFLTRGNGSVIWRWKNPTVVLP